MGNFSFDQKAGSLNNLFAFSDKSKGDSNGQQNLFLDPATGQPAKG